jgi:hypothetical protein
MMRLESICAHAGMPLTHPTAADQPVDIVSRGHESGSEREHTHNVAEWLLQRSWCKFTNPMILSPSCRRHRCHLSERSNHSQQEDPSNYHHPDRARCTTIKQRKVCRPCHVISKKDDANADVHTEEHFPMLTVEQLRSR